MAGQTGSGFGWMSHAKRGADTWRSYGTWGRLGPAIRSRSRRNIVFGELRTAVEGSAGFAPSSPPQRSFRYGFEGILTPACVSDVDVFS